MNNYKCVISYDGSRYNGFQKQANVKETIQEVIEKTLSEYFEEQIEIFGSGRTDAGVHAIGQVINFKTTKSIKKGFLVEINDRLPNAIVIKKVDEADERFHARYNATSKIYVYKILNKEIGDPFVRKYSYHIPISLDFSKMEQASKHLIGEHDFVSFTSVKTKKSTTRNIKSIKFSEENSYLNIEICGDGFLYNMVRIIMGALIQVGEGDLEPDDVRLILEAKERDSKCFKAPARGLFLKSVGYDEFLQESK